MRKRRFGRCVMRPAESVGAGFEPAHGDPNAMTGELAPVAAGDGVAGGALGALAD